MAENQLASGGASAKAEPPPPRPTITLPPRSSYESLFRFGGAAPGVGGASEVSPGPMTLVSSFFAEDPESDCRSFSQLLAGAMASPAAMPARGFSAAEAEEMTSAPSDSGGGILRSNQPLNLVVMQSPYFTVPPGLSPASLLESPAAGLFAAASGQFGISHQQALAQVTAQAAQAHSHTHNQAEYPLLQASTSAPMTHPATSGMNMTLLQQMPLQTSDANNVNSESADASNYDQRSQPMGIIADKPADDGYNWRKYGQKQVKGSEYPRSYYKCTHPSCPVKKKVEHSFDGHVTEIIYKGQHNHQQPPPNKRNNGFSRGNNMPNASLGFHNNSDALGGPQRQSSDGMSVSLISKRDTDSAHGASEQLSESSDGEEVGNAELGLNEGDVNNTDQKRRKIDTKVVESNSSHVVSEPRIIVQTTSEVDLLDDGYRWRKYGQKVVKGNPHPRSYYKCTSAGCTVRKHVERASTDAKAVVTTYEGKHNHDVPTARNNSHSTAGGGAVPNNAHPKPHNMIPNNQHLLNRPDSRNGLQRPIPVRLKEEHDAM